MAIVGLLDGPTSELKEWTSVTIDYDSNEVIFIECVDPCTEVEAKTEMVEHEV